MEKKKASSTSKKKSVKKVSEKSKSSPKTSKGKTTKAKKSVKKPTAESEDKIEPQSEEKSQSTLDILRAILESMTDGVVVTDEVGTLIGANQAFIHMYGYEKREEVLSKNALEFVAESDREKVMLDLAQTVENQSKDTREYKMLTKDGREIDTEISTSALLDNTGNAIGTIAVMRDITERIEMQEELRKAAEKMRIMFDTLGNIFIVTNMKLNIVNANDATSRMLGYQNEDALLNKSILELIRAEDKERVENIIRKTLSAEEGSGTQHFECKLDSKGNEIDVEATIDLLRDCTGTRTGLIFNAKDVTERKQMEAKIRESEEKLSAIFETITDGIVIIDLNGTIKDTNLAGCTIAGYESKDEVIGKNGIAFADDPEKMAKDLAKIVTGETTDKSVVMLKRKDGTRFYCEITAAMLKDASGNHVGIVAVERDVTDRMEMQEKVRESEEKVRTVFEAITDGIVIVDLDGTVLDTNLAGCTIVGYDNKEEIIGRNSLEFTDDPEKIANDMMKAISGEAAEDNVVAMKRKDGSRFFCEVSAAVLNDAAGNPVGVVAVERDVTEREKMAEEIRSTAEKLRTILESMTDGVAVTDEVGNLVEVNQAHCRMYGYSSKAEVIGKNALDFVAESDRERVMMDIGKTMQTGSKDTREYRMVRKDGTELDAEISTSALFDSSGNPAGTIAVMRDITERKQMQEELRKTAEKMRILFDTIGDMFIVTDMKTNISSVNGAAAKLLGYGREEELAGSGILEFIAGKDCTRVIDIMNKTLRTEVGSGTTNLEFKFVSKEGREFDVEATIDLLRDCTSYPVGLVITARDVTERKQMLERVRSSEEKVRTILESMTDGVAVTDEVGNLVDVNEAHCIMYGYASKAEVIGKNALDFVAESDRERVMMDIGKTMQTGSKDTREYRMVRKNGTELDAEISTSPLFDGSGKAVGTIAVMRDITERKQMQEELRKTAEKMRILFDTVGDMLIVTNMKLDIASANGAAAKLLGYEKEDQLSGKSVMEFITGKDRTRILGVMNNTLSTTDGSGTTNFECKFISRIGKEFDVEATVDLLRDCTSYPVGLVITCRDVTERKRMMEQIRASEEKLLTIFETINDGLVIVDIEGNISDMNTAACRLSGHDKQELIGTNPLVHVAEEDQQRLATDMLEAIERGSVASGNLVYKLKRKDGTPWYCEMSTSVIKDGEGNQTGFIAVERDVTERLKMEKQLKEQTSMLIQSEKKSTLGTLVNGVAHELNNPMTGIINYAQHCLRHTDQEDRRYEVLQDIEKEARRCANIIWNLITFARLEAQGEEEYRKSSISILVDRVLLLLNHRLSSENISVTKHFDELLPQVMAQETNIEQVLFNLLSNSIDAMKGRFQKDIRIEGKVRDGFVELSITDTGAGITPESLKRIFDPFYTTKTVGEGTGLGLSVSQSICRQHGGDLVCESQTGVGTTFTIKLPIPAGG